MKVVVIGGTGLIGSKLVSRIQEHGHEVVPASPASGVNTLTGEGLASALAGTQVVVDVSNSPSFETSAALEFFTTSTRNQLDSEVEAAVRHHVALSVVGTQRLAESGYFRAKMAQEAMIQESSIPYSILHATQFFEFINTIADSATEGDTVRLPPILVQPVAADDVADALCEVALGDPVNGTVEVAGPQQYRLDQLVEDALRVAHDGRVVRADSTATYFGVDLDERALLPEGDPRITKTYFNDWQSHSAGAR